MTCYKTCLAFCFFITFWVTSTWATDITERPDLYAVFGKAKVNGSMAIYDATRDLLILVNKSRAQKRFVPASTFKIANSLIALETGVIKDENEIIPYGGKPQPVRAWEKNMSIREAIPISAVPIYQELAKRIGLKRYREWLKKLNYGNQLVGSEVDTFWLKGPLAISAAEQAQFNSRLATKQLKASGQSQTILHNILHVEQTASFNLYAKTGWAKKTGWWSGWIERDGKVYGFALNMDMPAISDAPKRIIIAKDILTKLNLYK